jgi:hypothetical protein
MHINYVRAHGYGLMQPVPGPDGQFVAPRAEGSHALPVVVAE